jgi:hypothetical protein
MSEAEKLTTKHPWATEMECLNRLDNNGNVNQPMAQEPDADKGESKSNNKNGKPAPGE